MKGGYQMKYILAKSAAEALEALLAEEGKARIIAGGSDVMVDMEAGKLAPQTLVDITTADDMKGIRIQDDQLIIGAAVTLTEIARSPLIRQYFPSLCQGAGSVGSLQIRNSATLVGNVVNRRDVCRFRQKHSEFHRRSGKGNPYSSAG